jgi:hypothetical protein
MVRLWEHAIVSLRQMGNGSLAEGIRRCILAANNQTQPVPTSALSQRVPVAPQRERLPVSVPPASRLPRSITSWSDDDEWLA